MVIGLQGRLLSALVVAVATSLVSNLCTGASEPVDSFASISPPDVVIIRVRPGFTPSQAPPGAFYARGEEAADAALLSQTLARWHVQSVRRATEPLDAELASRLGLDRYYVIECSIPTDAGALAQDLNRLGIVEVAEVDRASSVLNDQDSDEINSLGVEIPNDPYFREQWGLENTGQVIRGIPGVADADVDATKAWSMTHGSEDVIVAVLDAGVSLSHPELRGQLVDGQNFTSGNPNDIDDSWVSHGTHIAGIIAARWGNIEGIAGLAPDCKVMPVRVVNRYGWTYEEWVSQGVIWATDHGASVLNISLGFTSASSLQRAAIQYAFESDVVICASSGNLVSNPIGFPAALPETIAVGATDNRDELASFTSTGPELSLCAPGRDICSLWDTSTMPDTYEYKSGTSFAVPQVAGVAALMRSVNPALTARDVRRILAVTCKDLGDPGRDDHTGWGRLNARAAVSLASTYPTAGDDTCTGDLNGDGQIDFADLQVFLAGFTAGDPLADRNHDGNIDVFDVIHYLDEYVKGCPLTTYEP